MLVLQKLPLELPKKMFIDPSSKWTKKMISNPIILWSGPLYSMMNSWSVLYFTTNNLQIQIEILILNFYKIKQDK